MESNANSSFENKITQSRWAAPVNGTDSPMLEPIPHITVPPMTLNPPSKSRDNNQWRRNEEQKNPNFDIQVSNIDQAVTRNMIRNLFVANPINIFMQTGMFKTSAIVSFKSKEDAHNALSLNGKVPHNCPQQTSRLYITFYNSTDPPLMDTPRALPGQGWDTSNTRTPPTNGPHNPSNTKFNEYPSKIPRDFNKLQNINKPINPSTEKDTTHTKPPTEPLKRQPIKISKRTKPVVEDSPHPRNIAIFGNAKPINDLVSIGLEPYHKEDEAQAKKKTEKNLSEKPHETPIFPTKPEIQTPTPVVHSPSSLKPRRPFLRIGRDEIKKLINATHNTSSTFIKKNKENPFGEATPITVKEVPETEENEAEKSNENSTSNQPNSYSSHESHPNSPNEHTDEADKNYTETMGSESNDTTYNTPKTASDPKAPSNETFESPANNVSSPIISKTPNEDMKISQSQLAQAKPKTSDSQENTNSDSPNYNIKKETESEPATETHAPKAGENIWFIRRHNRVTSQQNETESDKKATVTPPTTTDNTRATSAEIKFPTQSEASANKEKTPKNGTNSPSDQAKRYASPASFNKGRNPNRKFKEYTTYTNRSDTNSTSPQKQNSQHLQQGSTDRTSRNIEFNSKNKPGSERFNPDQKRFNPMMFNDSTSRGMMGIDNRGLRNETPSRAKEFRSSSNDGTRGGYDSYNSKKTQNRADNSDTSSSKNRIRSGPNERDLMNDKSPKSKTEVSKGKSNLFNSMSSSYGNTFPNMNTHKNTSNNEPSHVKTQNRFSLLNTDDN